MTIKQTTLIFGITNVIVNQLVVIKLGFQGDVLVHLSVALVSFLVASLVWKKIRGYEMYGASIIGTFLTVFLSSYFSMVLIFLLDVIQIGENISGSMGFMDVVFTPIVLTFYLIFYVGVFVIAAIGLIGCLLTRWYRKNHNGRLPDDT